MNKKEIELIIEKFYSLSEEWNCHRQTVPDDLEEEWFSDGMARGYEKAAEILEEALNGYTPITGEG